MKKLKVLTVVGTRPEIIRLSRVIACLDIHCDHKLVHTGQNYDYELNEIFFNELGIRKPSYFLGAAGKNASTTIGQVISSVDTILEKEKPADRLFGSIAAEAICVLNGADLIRTHNVMATKDAITISSKLSK